MARTPFIVIAGLILILVAGTFASEALKGASTANQGTRAVIVPTTDRARAVVVPACNTGVRITPAGAAGEAGMIGATVVALPRASGDRVVLVPRCSKLNGVGASGTLSLPSAAFVLKIGTRISAGKAARVSA